MSNWSKWSVLIDKYNIHPKMREEAADKVEKYYKEFKESNLASIVKKLDSLMLVYDRRDNVG